MNKFALTTGCLLLTLSGLALANTPAAHTTNRVTGCEFTDTMNVQAPNGSSLLDVSANGLYVQRHASDLGFDIIGHCQDKYDGTVTATIGIDKDHATTLTIKDGQFMMNPEITNASSKGGYFYSGMDHSTGTYVYTLKFSKQ